MRLMAAAAMVVPVNRYLEKKSDASDGLVCIMKNMTREENRVPKCMNMKNSCKHSHHSTTVIAIRAILRPDSQTSRHAGANDAAIPVASLADAKWNVPLSASLRQQGIASSSM